MSYKFQRNKAVMSGSLVQEGAISADSLNAGDGGIANAGAVSGVTTLDASGLASLDGGIDVNGNMTVSAAGAIAGATTLAMGGALSGVTTIAASGLASIASISVDDGSTIGPDSVADLITLSSEGDFTFKDGAYDLNIASHDGTNGLALAGTIVSSTAAELNLVDSFAVEDADLTADAMVFFDATDSKFKRETYANYATSIAGVGLVASAGSLAVQASGSVHISGDKVSISGSIAGEGIKYLGGVDSISSIKLNLSDLSAGAGCQADDEFAGYQSNGANITYSTQDLATKFAGTGLAQSAAVMTLDLSEYSEVVPASNDAFLTLDSDNSNEQLCTVDALATLYAGAGMAASSGVIAVVNATNGGLTVNANDMELDFCDLSAVAIDVAADSFGFCDATDSSTNKTTIALLATAMAGAGITATNGVFSSDSAGTPTALVDGQACVEGLNYASADLTANLATTLPASPTVGDQVIVKAKGLSGAGKITISKAGSHTIDGENSVVIESTYGAITFVYAVANDWRII